MMSVYPIRIELTRHAVQKQRDRELCEASAKARSHWWYLSVGIAYLDRHANEDKYLILVLLCSSLPPKLETPEPIARSAEALAMARRQWVVRLISTKQLDLPAAHDEEVLVRSLE